MFGKWSREKYGFLIWIYASVLCFEAVTFEEGKDVLSQCHSATCVWIQCQQEGPSSQGGLVWQKASSHLLAEMGLQFLLMY
jgi:hypothetical protein